METVTIAIIAILVVWYLGNSINTILANSGKLAVREFDIFEETQALRHVKSRQDNNGKVEDLGDIISKKDLRAKLGL